MTALQPLGRRPESMKPDTGPASADPAKPGQRGLPTKRGFPTIGPILPARLRPLNRPTLWVEIALIGISYFFYRVTQNAAIAGQEAPYNRGWDILRLEHTLHIDFEQWLNHTIAKIDWLIVSMNYYYATLHFIVPIAVLIWVYIKFPDRYRAIRTVMFAMTGLALIGFYFYALAPPRLLNATAFIDTFCVHHTWGKKTCSGVAGMSGSFTNEFAAMPSLHIGWSVWCALAIAHLAERNWVRVLGVLYPVATFTVIIATANHYVLDAVGGLFTLAAGFLVQRLMQGRPVYRPQPAPEPPEMPRQAATADGGTAKVVTSA